MTPRPVRRHMHHLSCTKRCQPRQPDGGTGVRDLPLLLADVARWYAASTVALGIKTGLTDALLAGGGTATELAATAHVDVDNTARWADAMVAGGYATLLEERYAPVEDAIVLSRSRYLSLDQYPCA